MDVPDATHLEERKPPSQMSLEEFELELKMKETKMIIETATINHKRIQLMKLLLIILCPIIAITLLAWLRIIIESIMIIFRINEHLKNLDMKIKHVPELEQ